VITLAQIKRVCGT